MYKIIELPLTSGQRSHTIGKTELNLQVGQYFNYGYKSKETKQLEVNQYLVESVDTNNMTYKVSLWSCGTLWGYEWANAYTIPTIVPEDSIQK